MKKLEFFKKLNSNEMGSMVAGRCIDNVSTGAENGDSSDNNAHHYDNDGNYTGYTQTVYYDM